MNIRSFSSTSMQKFIKLDFIFIMVKNAHVTRPYLGVIGWFTRTDFQVQCNNEQWGR